MLTAIASLLLLPSQEAKLPPLKPWKDPFTVIGAPVVDASLVSRLGGDKAGVFVDGDRITFLGKGAVNPFVIPDWMQAKPIRDEARDLWVTQIRMPDAERFFFTYWVKDGDHRIRRVFRAARAPKAPTSAGKLLGSLQTIPFASRELGEVRSVTVYLPPNGGEPLDAVYMADGQSCEDFARILEPLILAKRVAPTAIIGLFHGEFKGDIAHYDFQQDFRAREYLKFVDPERFESHLRFVTGEVVPWAERKFNLAPGSRHRALFGFSNGGAFALVASAERSDIFGAALPFSIAVFDRDGFRNEVRGKRLPRYWITAGTMESFSRISESATDLLREAHASVRYDTYVAGHDSQMWELGFARAIPKVFPYR